MKIKDNKCKCGRDDFFFADKGNQTGIYCSYCGKWLKWADKDEQNLRMKQEPCEDCVSRQAVLDKLNCLGRNAFKDDTDYDNFFDFVDNFSPVTPQQKMGHWIWNVEKGYCKCSKCGIGMGHTEFDYCPNCGAKMVE